MGTFLGDSVQNIQTQIQKAEESKAASSASNSQGNTGFLPESMSLALGAAFAQQQAAQLEAARINQAVAAIAGNGKPAAVQQVLAAMYGGGEPAAGEQAAESRGLQLGQWQPDPARPGTTVRSVIGNDTPLTNRSLSGDSGNTGTKATKENTGIAENRSLTGERKGIPQIRALGAGGSGVTTSQAAGPQSRGPAGHSSSSRLSTAAGENAAKGTQVSVKAPAVNRSTNWSSAADGLKTIQDLGNEIQAQSFAGGKPDADLVKEYNRLSEKYFIRPTTYTAENVGNYIDRAYYLSLKNKMTEAEKQEAKEILNVIEAKSPLTRLLTDKGDYYQNLYNTNRQEAWSLSMVAENLKNRLQEGNALSAGVTGLTRGAGLGSMQDLIGANAEKRIKAGSTENTDLMMAQQSEGLKLGEAFTQKQHPAAYGAGNLAGNIIMLEGLGNAAGLAADAAVNGTGLARVLMNAGKVGETIAKYLPGVLRSGMSFGANSAIQNAGRYAGGELSRGDYLAQIGISAGAGAAGSAAAQAAGTAMGKILQKPWKVIGTNELTGEAIRNTLADSAFARTVTAAATGAIFAGGDTAVRELSNRLRYGESYTPDVGEIIQGVLIAGAFGAIGGYRQFKQEAAYRQQNWSEGSAAATAIEEELARKYFPGAKNWEEAKGQFRKYAKEYHPDRFAEGSPERAEAERIMAEINRAGDWLKSLKVGATAAAGEEARARKAEAESRGDTKAAAKAERDMKNAIRLLNEYAADQDYTMLQAGEAKEALEVLNTLTTEEVPESGSGIVPGRAEGSDQEGTPKKKGRTEEEKRESARKGFDQERRLVEDRGPEFQAWIQEKYKLIRDQLEALNVGDEIYGPDGDAVGQVIYKTEDGMTITYFDKDGEIWNMDRIPAGTLPSNPIILSFTDPETGRLYTSKGAEGETVARPALRTEMDAERAGTLQQVANHNAPIMQENKAEERRQTALRMLETGTDPVSMRELGVSMDGSGKPVQTSQGQNLTVLPEATWDPEMQLVNEWSRETTGRPVTYVQGNMFIIDGSGTKEIESGYSEEGVVIRADSDRRTVTQIFEEDILGGLQKGAQNETIIEGTAKTQYEQPGQEPVRPAAGEDGLRIGEADTVGAGAAAGTAPAVGTAGETAADGSGGRIPDRRAGGVPGQLDGDAGAGSGRTDGEGRDGSAESIGDALRERGEVTHSSREYGIRNGTEEKTFYIVPEDMLSPELRNLRYKIKNSTGYENVDFISGSMIVMREDGTRGRAHGFCDPTGKRIAIRIDHPTYTPEQIGRHEEFHALQAKNPGLVKAIRERVVNRFGREEMNRIIQTYIINRRGAPNTGSGTADVTDESALRVLEEIFADANGRMNVFGAGAERLFFDTRASISDNWWNQTSRTERNKITRKTPPSQEEIDEAKKEWTSLKNLLERLEYAGGEWIDAESRTIYNWNQRKQLGRRYETARERYMSLAEWQRNTETEGEAKYFIDENYIDKLHEWIEDGKPDDDHLLLGTTSEPLRSIGVEDKEIWWDTSKVLAVQRDHPEITDDVLEHIPEILEMPILVMESKTWPNRITLFGEVYGDNGLPVMAVMELLPVSRKGYVLDELKVVNSYTRQTEYERERGITDIRHTQDTIDTSNILYIDPNKNRTDSWLSLNQLQLPLGITSYGPIGKITLVPRDVKGKLSADTKTAELQDWKKKLLSFGATLDESKDPDSQHFSMDEDDGDILSLAEENDPAYNEAITPMLEEHHWPDSFPQVTFNTNVTGLTRDKALHRAAKNGDREAADRLVQKVIKPDRIQKLAEAYPNARIVPVWSELEEGNKLPFAYAEELANYGLQIERGIVQIQKGGHTSSDGIHRLMSHSAFEGEVIPGQEYILADDVLTFGGTLNDLRMYIESRGGKVVAATVLATGRNGSWLAARPELVQEIYEKHGEERINGLLRKAGIAYDAASLTDRQARYIRDVDYDTLRDRIHKEKVSAQYRRSTPDRGRTESQGEGREEQELKFSFDDSEEDLNLFGEAFDGDTGQPEKIPGARYGSAGYTLNNRDRIGITYAFVPLDSLTASNATDGSINPAYPQELQPRDRTRAESLRQTMDMANNLIPERLEKNPDVQNGAPLVRSDGVVISGNGRSMALRMAYEQGKAEEYTRYLRDHANEWGLNPEDLPEDMPVLVRIAEDGADWEQLARDANVSTVASKSDSELARTDAKNLARHPEVLSKLIPDEDGELNTAANREFISDFINIAIPEAERGEMRTDDGLLSQRGLKRMQNALFEMAYGDASLLEKLSERLDNDMKNVTNALLAAAPQVVAFENAVDEGSRYDIGLRKNILEAVRIYADAKQQGQTVAERTANLGFDEPADDRSIYIARFIEGNKASGKQLRTMLQALGETADELGDHNQMGFFEDEEAEKDFDTVLRGAIRKYEDATGRQLPRPERWGAGTLEEIAETRGLTRGELTDYYLRGGEADQGGMEPQADGRDQGEHPEEAGRPVPEGLTPGAGENGRGGSDLGRERDGGRGPGSGRDDGGRVPDVGEGSLTLPEPPGETPPPEASGAERRQEPRPAEKKKQRKTQFPDYNPAPEDAGKSFRQIAEEIRSRAAAERAERMKQASKKDFFGTPALEKLGVKIEGALGNYRNTKQLREIEKAAYQLKKTIRRREKDLNATAKEKQLANGLAAGIFTPEDLGPNVNRAKIEELADYYSLERTINDDTILQRRRQINAELDEMIYQMLPDDPGYKVPPMFVLNHRTPERLCRQIFGDEKGKEVYDRVFRPVAVNEAEKIRFIARQFNDVREIQGADGKRSELTKDERMLVQQVLEGTAAAELVAGMEMDRGRERIEDAAQNIVNGTDPGDAAREHSLDENERGIAEQYARWLQTKAVLESGDFDTVKIDNAVKIYKEKYDQFYDAINDFLVAHGYKPIGFIKGYAPHMQMQEDLNVFAGYLKSLGINEDVTRLPANIAGKTAGLKPNKRWNPFFLSRTGDETDFDIAKGFQSYVTYLADVLYHTDDIMRVRALSRHYREAGAPDSIKENLEWARYINSASPEVKREQLQSRGILSRDEAVSDEEIGERFDKWVQDLFDGIQNTTKYSDLVMYLDNYANILAGKQSMSDRGGEYDWGRESLTRANRLVSAFARTQVAGNLSSAVSQFSQIPMITAELGPVRVLQAIRDYQFGKLRRGAWAQESDHLTERAGSGALVTDAYDMVLDKLFSPLRMIDGFTATIAVRAKYLEQIEQGKSHEEAMKEADAYAKRVQGSRAKGSKPLAFHSKKLTNQMLHMFQLEMFNSWEHVSQDLPADFREIERTQGKEKAAMALAMVVLKYLITAFLVNRTTEELTGGTPAPFDLLGITSNFIASGYGLTTNRFLLTAIDNAMEKMWDQRIFETDPDRMREEFDWNDALSGAGYEVGSDIPYLRNVMGLMGLGDQTLPLPLMGAGQELEYLWKDVRRDIDNGRLSGQTGMDLLHLMNQAIPGGRQLTKSMEGLQLMKEGGRYLNGQLYYPVENTVGNWAKALLFGRSALEESNAYYAGDDRKLSVGATELYQMLTDQGSAGRREAYEALQGARSLNEDQTAYLQSSAEDGGDPWTLWQTMQDYKEAANDKTLGSFERGRQTRAVITGADLTDEERLSLYRVMDKDNAGKADKLEAIMATDLSWEDAVKAYDAYAEIEANENLSKKEQAEQWASWVNHQGYSPEQQETVRDQIKFWGSYAIEDTTVDKLSETGLNADSVDQLAEILNGLEPEQGRDKVTDLQKYKAIAGSSMSLDDQWKAIIGVTPDSYTSTLEKITIMQDMGITPSVWTQSKQAMYDADDAGNDNGSTDQTEAKQALDAMNIPDDQKAILWQLTNKSWSWKKNPYDTDIGQEVYALMHDGDTGSSKSTTKKKSGGGRRGGGGGRKGGGLILGEAFTMPENGRSGMYEQILKMWKRRKYSRAQILALVRTGKLTQEEADEILASSQDEEPVDGGLVLGAAEEMSA